MRCIAWSELPELTVVFKSGLVDSSEAVINDHMHPGSCLLSFKSISIFKFVCMYVCICVPVPLCQWRPEGVIRLPWITDEPPSVSDKEPNLGHLRSSKCS